MLKDGAWDKNRSYISVYKAIGGWQTRLFSWYEDDGMWDVACTGLGPYRTREAAVGDAQLWAASDPSGVIFEE